MVKELKRNHKIMMIPKQKYLLYGILALALVGIIFIIGCVPPTEKPSKPIITPSPTETPATTELPENEYKPREVSIIFSKDDSKKPLYLFLFTHTEDHINHKLSEERYTRLLPDVKNIDKLYPNLDVTWTIMFQGADAETVYERNRTTGIADMLKEAADEGVVKFGYHAHHDPTYLNRPQKSLSKSPSFAEGLKAFDEWISCRKDPVYGGCVEKGAGGLLAIEKFGSVEVISGVGYTSGAQIERSFGMHAIRKYIPDHRVGFGFPDHGPGKTGSYKKTAQEFMRILTPTPYTSGTVFWMDDKIRSNDGNPFDSVEQIKLTDDVEIIKEKLNSLDRTKPQLMNTFIGTKYLYTVEGKDISPTKYAYANPENPELPDKYIKSEKEIEKGYQITHKTLNFLAETIASEKGSKFVDADDIITMISPDSYFHISREDLDILARYLLTNWDGAPPAYATTGKDHYSLRDMVFLLSKAIANPNVDSIELEFGYGPIFDTEKKGEVKIISVESVKSLARTISNLETIPYKGSYVWKEEPNNILAEEYKIDGSKINTAQLLFALAYVYSAEYNGYSVKTVTVPATANAPKTLGLLEALGCINCIDSAWSLKPATFYNLLD